MEDCLHKLWYMVHQYKDTICNWKKITGYIFKWESKVYNIMHNILLLYKKREIYINICLYVYKEILKRHPENYGF